MRTFLSGVALSILGLAIVHADPFEKAKVTQTVQIVSLVDQQKGSQPAKIGDTVAGDTAIKTGSESRSELTFPDQTVLRIGPDAFFNFKAGGRSMNLESGTMLFSSPKGEGGGQVQAGTVTCAVTGTNFLVSLLKNGDVQMVVLEGKVVLYFTANPTVRREFKPGDLITIPKGDSVIGNPVTIELKNFLATNGLLGASGFPPLYCQALLNSIAESQSGTAKLNLKSIKNAAIAAMQAAAVAKTSAEKAAAQAVLVNALAAYAASLPPGTDVGAAITRLSSYLALTVSPSQANQLFAAIVAASPADWNLTLNGLAQASYTLALSEVRATRLSPVSVDSPQSVPGGSQNGQAYSPSVVELIGKGVLKIENGKLVPTKPVSSSGAN